MNTRTHSNSMNVSNNMHELKVVLCIDFRFIQGDAGYNKPWILQQSRDDESLLDTAAVLLERRHAPASCTSCCSPGSPSTCLCKRTSPTLNQKTL
jgi:hypothetical protein